MRRIFRNLEVDAEFRRQGYVVLPFLDPHAVRALLDAFERIENRTGRGFHATMYDGTPAIRRAVHDAVVAAYQPRLDELLDRYRICVGNFMVKEPADPSGRLCVHLDWSFVDEPEHVAVHVWCPLVDVDRRNGCLSIVPRSHRLVDPIRAHADLIQYREIMPTLEREYLLEMPMKAGNAILHDGRLLHGSPANTTPVRRVAAACTAVPREAAVRHAVRISPKQVELFEVGDEFFWTYVLGERPRGVPSLGAVDYEVKQLGIADLERAGLVQITAPAAP